ncbi:MAG: hypothetical protein ACYDC1_07620 [Limisphaerales bacterium]
MKYRVWLKSGAQFELETSGDHLLEGFSRYLLQVSPRADDRVCDVTGPGGSSCVMDLREVAAVIRLGGEAPPPGSPGRKERA